MQQFLHNLVATHPQLAAGVLAWVVLATVLNVLLALRSPQQWAALAESNPKTALVLNILVRALGPIDLVSVIQHIQQYVNQQAQAAQSKEKSDKS